MFPEILKRLRLDMKLTQTELATKLRVSQRTIANYESGDRSPDFEMLIEMAGLFCVTTDYLLGQSAIPDEDMALIRTALANIDKDYLIVVQEAHENKVSPEVLRKLIQIYKDK